MYPAQTAELDDSSGGAEAVNHLAVGLRMGKAMTAGQDKGGFGTRLTRGERGLLQACSATAWKFSIACRANFASKSQTRAENLLSNANKLGRSTPATCSHIDVGLSVKQRDGCHEEISREQSIRHDGRLLDVFCTSRSITTKKTSKDIKQSKAATNSSRLLCEPTLPTAGHPSQPKATRPNGCRHLPAAP